MSSAAQLFLKKGLTGQAIKNALHDGNIGSFFFLSAASAWVVAGLLFYGLSMFSWLVVLTKTDVGTAYPMVGIGFILTALVGAFWLGEPLGIYKLAGIALIMLGVYAITRIGGPA